ncbi:uncharacterized protein At3g49055 isoform X1 [Amborella trichopoda]|uniref:uncharacterized protein At3g49055 isoform X1 n=1 Tax=Amborella trichopoda TaxID=13333 RepID=UPI0009BF2FF9|nr:uncharacterized protein At3g49055 isoform X1 [Amborella trichopoda]|eukprot:XP_020527260.1 uncharacterized protein At3g49055 isoform X1 [Amborella trichopoda]
MADDSSGTPEHYTLEPKTQNQRTPNPKIHHFETLTLGHEADFSSVHFHRLGVQAKAMTMEDNQKTLEERTKWRRFISNQSEVMTDIHARLCRVLEKIGASKLETNEERHAKELGFDEELDDYVISVRSIWRTVTAVEDGLKGYEEIRVRERKELENSVVSLTEENRDINRLLRVALMEKEAVERDYNRLKGGGDQRRGAILQIAERGLQKVGFGFMMGFSTTESEACGNSGKVKSDESEGEEEVVSVASTVENIMKNLRLENAQRKQSLEESRADTERLQSLTENQAQKLVESALCIKDLEERETTLAQNVEELIMEMTATEEEVARWREACELEVEAGKHFAGQRDTEAEALNNQNKVAMLREELEKTRASLEIANGKLKVKEELAVAAMAAQEAAERSLDLADSRSAELRDRIEELSRQVEEAEGRAERGARRKVRYVCWPWRALRVFGPPGRGGPTWRRVLPDMEALLH